MFPKILQTIMHFTLNKEDYTIQVTEVNSKLLKIVLKILKNKNDFKYIFKKLKK